MRKSQIRFQGKRTNVGNELFQICSCPVYSALCHVVKIIFFMYFLLLTHGRAEDSLPVCLNIIDLVLFITGNSFV